MKPVVIIIIIVLALLIFDSCWNIFVNNAFPKLNDFIRDFIMCAIVAGILFYTSVKVADGFLFIN